MSNSAIDRAYRDLCAKWEHLSASEQLAQLDHFKIAYSYNSGRIENPEITYHDTAEVFDRGGISNFTGDVRTIYEINNLKQSWSWLISALGEKQPIDIQAILEMHRILTTGTYDETRWMNGERPGTFKLKDYRVANDVGMEPSDIEEAMTTLLDEINEALVQNNAKRNALTISAYAHACLVDIHPFADGNGRCARLLMNWILLLLNHPPCSINVDDRLAYFGALDAFHEEDNLEPFKDFCRVQTIKTWKENLPDPVGV